MTIWEAFMVGKLLKFRKEGWKSVASWCGDALSHFAQRWSVWTLALLYYPEVMVLTGPSSPGWSSAHSQLCQRNLNLFAHSWATVKLSTCTERLEMTEQKVKPRADLKTAWALKLSYQHTDLSSDDGNLTGWKEMTPSGRNGGNTQE